VSRAPLPQVSLPPFPNVAEAVSSSSLNTIAPSLISSIITIDNLIYTLLSVHLVLVLIFLLSYYCYITYCVFWCSSTPSVLTPTQNLPPIPSSPSVQVPGSSPIILSPAQVLPFLTPAALPAILSPLRIEVSSSNHPSPLRIEVSSSNHPSPLRIEVSSPSVQVPGSSPIILSPAQVLPFLTPAALPAILSPLRIEVPSNSRGFSHPDS